MCSCDTTHVAATVGCLCIVTAMLWWNWIKRVVYCLSIALGVFCMWCYFPPLGLGLFCVFFTSSSFSPLPSPSLLSGAGVAQWRSSVPGPAMSARRRMIMCSQWKVCLLRTERAGVVVLIVVWSGFLCLRVWRGDGVSWLMGKCDLGTFSYFSTSGAFSGV